MSEFQFSSISSSILPRPRSSTLVEALDLLQKAALFMIIATLLVSIGIIASFMGILGISIVVPYPRPHEVPRPHIVAPAFGLAIVITTIGIAIAGAILALYAIFGKLLPSASKFSEYDPEFSTSATLMKIGLIVGFILLIVGFATVIILIGIPMIILAFIFLLIGLVGIAILCFKLYSKFNSTIFLVAGILFIISIFVSILGFVAWILVYVEAGTLKEKALRGEIA